ncbi:MAG: FkbM family methyltransferase [Bacteroidetes bacterium]|nr:FkbM family methyltransferase [Bacteroidota bacterium]
MSLKQAFKSLLVGLHLPITRNLRYDRYTLEILDKILKKDWNCIDIGCHKGEILDAIMKRSPKGHHFAFEPLPHLYDYLKEKYRSDNISVYSIALFDKKGETSFQYVVDAPAYSGIKRRKYASSDVHINELTVQTDLLDNVIPADETIKFIKIDVEGAEFQVLKGGTTTIKRCKPIIIFEFGLGAADYYDTQPEAFFSLIISDFGLQISTLKGFLHNHSHLTLERFCEYFHTGKEYYFVAHP